MLKKLLLLCFALLALPALAAEAPPEKIVTATLIADEESIVPGHPLKLGLLLAPKDGWHTYWENPGDAGTPTVLTWTLPSGFTASKIVWPMPVRITEGPLAIYGYPWPMLLPVTVTVPADLNVGDYYTFALKAQWLACKDICIPESADLDIKLRAVNNPVPSEQAPFFDAHEKHAPLPLEDPGHFAVEDKSLVLTLPLSALATDDIKEAMFFPREENLVVYAADQKFATENGQLKLTLQRASGTPDKTISGLLSIKSDTDQTHDYDVSFSSEGAAAKTIASAIAHPAMAAPDNTPFLIVMLLAVLGGLVLNLMPCVLPVLSLKALSLVKKSATEPEHVLRQGIAYTLGILVTFGIFSGILLSLRDGGNAIGWGYQMQSPAFVGFLIYLLFLVGLNLSGVFELPVLLGNTGGELANQDSAKGSFFTGVLAVAVATPCTAPFMATAVGAALTLPAWQAMIVFELLGLGLALPFLLISIFPASLRFLPRPGAWMQTFKEVLAFPMYASSIWLLWVLTLQTGAGGMAVALSGLLVIIAIFWLKSFFVNREKIYHLVSLLLFAILFAITLPMLSRMEISHDMSKAIDHETYSKEKLDGLRDQGKPVLVDATAAWCITCQVNAAVAIHTQRTMAAMKAQDVTLMQADWTQRNQEVTDFLAGFGYQGVPLVVYYPPDHGDPVILPQILTEDKVISTITGK